MDYDSIAKQVAEAVAKGSEAAKLVDDLTGSCNLDSPYIRVGKDCAIKRKTPKLEAALEGAGVNFYYSKNSYGGGKYMLHVPTGGQAHKRTAAAEVTAKELKHLDASVWYHAD